LGFIECASLPVSLQPSSPGTQAHLRTAGANPPSRSVLVVSHHLNGLLRLQLRGLVASHYQLEVRRFSSIPARQLPKQSGGLPGRLSRRRFSHPSEFSPRQQPYRVTHLVLLLVAPKRFQKRPGWFTNGRCPHDVPSRAPRCLSQSRCQDRFQLRFARKSRLQGFAPLSSPLRHAFIADCASLATPLGLVPLQGLPSLSLRAHLRTYCFQRAVSLERRINPTPSNTSCIPHQVPQQFAPSSLRPHLTREPTAPGCRSIPLP
jgi:hypothetical protein